MAEKGGAMTRDMLAVYDQRDEYAKRLKDAVRLLEAVRPHVSQAADVDLVSEIDDFTDMMREDGWADGT